MKVKIHLDFSQNNVRHLVYIVKYANNDVKITNCVYFSNPEIVDKFDKTEVLIKRYWLSVLKFNIGSW